MSAEGEVRADISAELKAAEEALKAASALLDLGLLRDAASRLYYSVFHAARALVFSAGVQPRSHEALRSLFARHFIKPGILSAEYSKLLGNLESTRLEGDYDTEFALGVEQIRPDLEKAAAFLSAARAVLAAGRWLP